MFEGFSDGGPTWGCEDDSLPPEPPKWWELLIVICGLVGLLLMGFRLFFYGI